MNTAAVSCNKSLNITYLRSISHQQETQATYLHTVQYISSWVGYLGGFIKKNVNSSNSTTSFLLGIFENKDVT